MEAPEVFGKSFLDYVNGDQDQNLLITSDIDGDDVVPVSYFFRELNDMPGLEQFALKSCRGTILDVGAGAGCHSMELQKTGFDVTSLEISKDAVSAMYLRNIRNPVVGDFFNFNIGDYDTILFLMNGIGIAGSFSRLQTLLKKAVSLLKPGGQILVESGDVMDAYYEEDGSLRINLNKEHPGEVNYIVRYRSYTSLSYPWLYIDYSTLFDTCAKLKVNCEWLESDPQSKGYLARITNI